MKKAKLMLYGIAIVAILGISFSFRTNTYSQHYVYTGAINQPNGATACTVKVEGAGISNGTISLNGTTSGFISMVTSATANLLTISQPIQIGTIGSVGGSLTLAGLTSGSAVLSVSATGGTLQLGGGNLLVDSSGNLNTTSFSTIASGTAIPAGGTAGTGYKFSSTSNFGIFFGSGAPTLAAAKGSLYLRSDGSSTSTRAYINTDGAATWTNITTGA